MRLSIRVRGICVLVLTGLMAACSLTSSPEDTVKTFYHAVAKQDMDKAMNQLALGNVSASEMIVVEGVLKMGMGILAAEIESNQGLRRIEVLELLIDGDSARVRVKLHFNNGKEDTQSDRLRRENGRWKIVLR